MKKSQERTEDIYDFILAFRKANGFPPTLQQIGMACGVARGTVAYHLDKLEAQGRIQREAHKSRSIRVTSHVPQNDDTSEEVYRFICEVAADEGIAPTQTEIASGCYLSRSAVRRSLLRLEAQGRIRRGEGQRSMEIINVGPNGREKGQNVEQNFQQ